VTLTKKQYEQSLQIINYLYLNGPASRSDIANDLDLTPAKVSKLTRVLLNDNEIEVLGEEISDKPGRNGILLMVKQTNNYYLGVELTSRSIKLCITDNMGHVEVMDIVECNIEDQNINEQDIIRIIKQFEQDNSSYFIKSIGIAIPGHHNESTNKIITNNSHLEYIDLKKIKSSFDRSVYCLNNVKCMSLRELYFNSNTPKDFLFIHIRDGMFCANMYKGKFYGDRDLIIGEIGHFVVDPNGERCECGKKGCLQTYISKSRILKKARMMYQRTSQSKLQYIVNCVEDIDYETIRVAYELNDPLIRQMVDEAVNALSILINNINIMVDSPLVFIHSELITKLHLNNYLRQKIKDNSSLSILKMPREYIIKNYSEQTGPQGACALSLFKKYNEKVGI
jgi:putative ROK family protein